MSDAARSIRHDVAFATARALLDVITPAMRPEELNEAFMTFLRGITAALVRYDELLDRRERRLRPMGPSDN